MFEPLSPFEWFCLIHSLWLLYRGSQFTQQLTKALECGLHSLDTTQEN